MIMEHMSEKKYKIKSKKELELALSLIFIDDDWLNRPMCKTIEEQREYAKCINDIKMELLKKDFDICIEDE